MQNLALGPKEEKFNAKIPFSSHLFSFRFFFSLSFPVLSNNALHIMQYNYALHIRNGERKPQKGRNKAGWWKRSRKLEANVLYFKPILKHTTLKWWKIRYRGETALLLHSVVFTRSASNFTMAFCDRILWEKHHCKRCARMNKNLKLFQLILLMMCFSEIFKDKWWSLIFKIFL